MPSLVICAKLLDVLHCGNAVVLEVRLLYPQRGFRPCAIFMTVLTFSRDAGPS